MPDGATKAAGEMLLSAFAGSYGIKGAALRFSNVYGRNAWKAGHNGPLILSSGESVTVNDMVDAARAVTGAEIPVEYVPAKPGEMPAVIIDISAAMALGYQPTMDLKAGIATVWPEFAETVK